MFATIMLVEHNGRKSIVEIFDHDGDAYTREIYPEFEIWDQASRAECTGYNVLKCWVFEC